MVLDSRQVNPENLAAKLQPPNFPTNARQMIAKVNAKAMPL
jgi:hypothetical protein